ncbi:MAG: MATE family efflux transporter [Pseudomonadota bacterium]
MSSFSQQAPDQASRREDPPVASVVDKTLLQLSFPLVLHALVGVVVTLADTVIISSYSANAAAAVSISNQVLWVAYELSAMFGVGAVVLISRELGAGNQEKAVLISESAIVANCLMSGAIAMILLIGARSIANGLNAPPIIVDDIVVYLRVAAVALLFNGLMMAATSSLRAFGRTRVILALGLIAYALYLGSVYVLVYGVGPFPELGVLGSALATLIVRIFGAAVLFVVVVRTLGLKIGLFLRAQELAHHFRPMLRLSYPSAIDNTAYGIYQMILVSYIARFDVAVILSRSFTLASSAVLTVVLMAISQSNEVLIGYRYGAKRYIEVYWCAIRSAAVAALLTTTLSAVLFFFAEPVIGLFTDDLNIIGAAKHLLYLTIFVQPLSALNTILFHSLKTLGDVVVPVVATQIMMWSLSVPSAYWLAVSLEMGVTGLWYVLIFEEGLKAIFMLYRFGRRARALA